MSPHHHPNAADHAHLPVAWQKIYAAQSADQLRDVYAEWCAAYDTDSVHDYGYAAPRRAAEELHRHLQQRGDTDNEDKQHTRTTTTTTNNNNNNACTTSPFAARIVDIGAGTGLVGQYLQALAAATCDAMVPHDTTTTITPTTNSHTTTTNNNNNNNNNSYKHLVAMDFSPAMLAVARQKQCYDALYEVDLNQSVAVLEAQQQTRFCQAFDAAVSVGTFTDNHLGIPALYHVLDMIKPGGFLTLSLTELFARDTSNGFVAELQALVDRGTLAPVEVTEPELYTSKVSETLKFRIWTYRVLK